MCEDLDGSDGKKYGALEASELFDVHMKKMAMTIAPVCRGTKMVCPALTVIAPRGIRCHAAQLGSTAEIQSL